MNRILTNDLVTSEMLPATKISTRDTPICYYARVYLDNEYQRWCTWANAKTGSIGRAVEVTRRIYDPMGDYVFKENVIKFQSNDTNMPEMEVVSGDVKIFVPRIRRNVKNFTS